ncbi:hypothetical protein [Dactylosporangium sp. NPDC048998]|uniref:hypothetical protein n=1 Tax=Dactylosporangium sp. NPDC048998 TaxID=3363976 RepID=UPI00371BBA26
MSFDPQTIEADLRAAMRTGPSQVAARPDPVARVESGVTRRRRRRLLVTTAAAALAVGTVVAGTGLIIDRPFRSTADTSTAVGAEPVAAAPQILRRSPRPDRQPCRIDNVDSMDWIVQSAPWGLSTGLALRPNNSDRCTLSGRPQLSGINTATGASEPIAAVDAGQLDTSVTRQFPATIDPGEPARIEIRGGKCPAGQEPRSYRSLVVTVGTQKIPLPSSRSLTGICGADVSQWFVEPPMLYAALNAKLEAPRVLGRGQDFTYTVQIDNVYARNYPLSSCPIFRLGIAATDIGPWQRINCTQAAIHGHDSIRFTLHGQIPPDTEPGQHKLTWMAAMSTGEATIADMGTGGTTVTITR